MGREFSMKTNDKRSKGMKISVVGGEVPGGILRRQWRWWEILESARPRRRWSFGPIGSIIRTL